MFKALAYLSEQGGEEAIEALGDELVEAVKKLALMIADFGGTVKEAKDGQLSTGDKIQKGLNTAADKVTSWFTAKDPAGGSGGTSTPSGGSSSSSGSDDVVFELQRMNTLLQEVLDN